MYSGFKMKHVLESHLVSRHKRESQVMDMNLLLNLTIKNLLIIIQTKAEI